MKSEGREFLEMLEQVADPCDLPLLLAACAGRRLYIPNAQASADNWITLAIGQVKADALIRRFDAEGWRAGEIQIPFNGAGLIGAVHRAIQTRIIEGFKAGKSVSAIAVECGITRRAVQLARKRLSRRGLLPSVDTAARLAADYIGPAKTEAVASKITVENLWGADAPDGNVLAAAAEAARVPHPSDDENHQAGDSPRERIITIILRECGRVETNRILAAAGTRPISFHPTAVRKPTHPLCAVLGETGGAIMAIKIVAAGLGGKPVRLGVSVNTHLTPIKQSIREKLLDRILPERVAQDLNVSLQLVRSQLQALRRAGKLPRARAGKRTLRGY